MADAHIPHRPCRAARLKEETMRYVEFVLILGVAVCLGVAPTRADDTKNLSHTVRAGAKAKIGTYYLIATDSCAAQPLPALSIKTPPNFGQITFEQKDVEPHQCPGNLVPGYEVYYQAGTVAGTDSFIYVVRYVRWLGTWTVNETVTIK
jgi:hypothetical protein